MSINYNYLLSLAKTSIEHGFIHNAPLFINPKFLDETLKLKAETFISLMYNDQNRGCIGNINDPLPIYKSVLVNSFKSAFKDPRFPPINKNIFNKIQISIHHLSSIKRHYYINNKQYFTTLIQPDDSVLLSFENKSAIMLALYQKKFPSLNDYVEAIKSKADIPESVSWDNITGSLIKTHATPIYFLSEIDSCKDFV